MNTFQEYQSAFEEALHSGPREKGGLLYSAPKEFTLSSPTLLQALSSDRTRSYLEAISNYMKDKKGYTISYHGYYARLFDSMLRFYQLHQELHTTLIPRLSETTATDGPPQAYGSLRLIPTETVSGINAHQVGCFQEWILDLHLKMCLLNTYTTETASYAKVTKGATKNV